MPIILFRKYKMSKITLLIGVIASGKSTYAKNHVDSNTFIVNKDSIREMIHGKYVYNISDEDLVNKIFESTIRTLIINGANIIIDECWATINVGARTRLIKFLCDNGISISDISIVFFSSTKNNVKRRLKNNHGNISEKVWKDVMNAMLREFEVPSEFSNYEIIKLED